MITSAIVVILVTFNQKIPVRMARTLFAPGILWACGVTLKVRGIEHLMKDESYVFVANHQSYLDIPALFRAVPHNLHFVAKKEIKWVPFIGWYMMATGMIFIDRSNRMKAIASLDKAGQLIKNGKDVLLFPEGTRSKTGEVGEFKKGPFLLASKADIRIVPIHISGTEHVLPAGNFFLKPGKVTVHIGAPITSSGMDLVQLILHTRKQVVELGSFQLE